MSVKRIALATVLVFVFVFIYEALFHGLLLKDLYMATANLWRSPAEMRQFFPLTSSVQIIFSLITVLFYCNLAKTKTISSGLKFGAFLGLLYGVSQFSLYAYMPIPITLASAWLVGLLIQNALIGLIIGAVVKRKS
jgi:hypothetical protein